MPTVCKSDFNASSLYLFHIAFRILININNNEQRHHLMLSNALTSCHHFPIRFKHVLNFFSNISNDMPSYFSWIIRNYDTDSFECVTHTRTRWNEWWGKTKRTPLEISTTQAHSFTRNFIFSLSLSLFALIRIQTLCITQILFLGMLVHFFSLFSYDSEKLIVHTHISLFLCDVCDAHIATHQFKNSHNANCVMWRGIEFFSYLVFANVQTINK